MRFGSRLLLLVFSSSIAPPSQAQPVGGGQNERAVKAAGLEQKIIYLKHGETYSFSAVKR